MLTSNSDPIGVESLKINVGVSLRLDDAASSEYLEKEVHRRENCHFKVSRLGVFPKLGRLIVNISRMARVLITESTQSCVCYNVYG